MKKQLTIGILALSIILNTVLVITNLYCKNKTDNKNFKVYSFQGENNDIRISNGLIVISSNKQIVNGGEISYIGRDTENIKSYSKNIYLTNRENNHTVLSNSVSSQYDNKTTFQEEFSLNKNVGTISFQKLFSEDSLNLLKDNLYFSLNYTKVNGETGNFIIKLTVKEIDIS